MLPTPVYICDAVRTPFGRYGGALATVRPDDLAALVLRALLFAGAGFHFWRVRRAKGVVLPPDGARDEARRPSGPESRA